MLRCARLGGGNPDKNKLIIQTNVPVDDYFSSPYFGCQIENDVVIVDNANARLVIRDSTTFSFLSKYSFTGNGILTNAKGICYYSNKLYVTVPLYVLIFDVVISGGHITNITYNTRFGGSGTGNGQFTGAMGICTDGANLVVGDSTQSRLQKFDMLGNYVSQIGSVGSSDDQFNNPKMLYYYGNKIYVMEATGARVNIRNMSDLSKYLIFGTSGSENGQFTLAYSVITDGTNIFTTDYTLARLQKFDMAGTYISKIGSYGSGNDQFNNPIGIFFSNDSLVVTEYGGNRLNVRGKDLGFLYKIGSSGDGAQSLFDTTVTTSSNTQVTFQFDDGFQYTTPLGTSHALSWNGFAGYSFRTPGPHTCKIRCKDGLSAITVVDLSSDYISGIVNLSKFGNLSQFSCYNGAAGGSKALITSLRLPNLTRIIQVSNFNSTPPVNPVIDISLFPSATQLELYWAASGPLSTLSRSCTQFFANTASGLSGSISDLPATLQSCYLYSTTGIVAGSIAALVALRDFRIYSMGWLTADVDLVINSMWTARAAYAYVTPSIQIGGTNGAPTGNVAAPPGGGVSNADWNWDGFLYWPLTPGAKIYDLAKDVRSEGFNKWSITYTGGAIVP